ncbi:CHKov1 [Culex quinquefasciatus]|uniref:CHKov1 n=1 Tax=Culex quinquefasciatus TaxID=7176 RepID=B0X2N4_CULQU|nr:CHKov1 [Culex quinquefasciatus]|eukprot:XP_001863906.1 CHKov1 [Culex quinquefasciatus]
MTSTESELSSAPSAECWRNAKFFEDVVRADLNADASEDVHVVDVQIANANAKVEGYMSLMHRAAVEFQVGGAGEIQTRSYVVKEKSSKVFGGDFVEKLAVFSKEIEVYETFLPAFEEFWGESGIQFGPRVLKTVSTPYTVIVMEDLKFKGFSMKQRSEGLSLELCEQVLSKVAKFHAASVVYYEQNGPYPEDFKEGILSEKLKEDMEAYYAPLLESYIQALEDLGFPLEVREALNCYRGKMYSYLCKLFEPDPAKFNVLNHGDLWVNNLQFSDTEVLLLDYQIAVYGSPSMDLLYFIINSSALDVRTDKFDHLIEHYHSELVKSLKVLNAKTTIPTLQDIQEDARQHGFLACVMSMEGLLMMLVPEVELNMEMLGSSTEAGFEYRKSFYSYPRVKSMLEKLVPFMWKRGFLKMD